MSSEPTETTPCQPDENRQPSSADLAADDGDNAESDSLPENLRAELHESFVLVDQNGSGTILAADLGRALRAMGQNPTDDDVVKVMNDAGLSESSLLTLDDYLNALSRYEFKSESEMSDDFNEALRVFDRWDTGRLNAADFETVLRKHCSLLTDDDIEELMSVADVQKDGTFDYTEFMNNIVSK